MGVFPWFPPISLVRWWIVSCNLLGNPSDNSVITLTNLLAAITSHQPSPPNLGSSLQDRNQQTKQGNCICERNDSGDIQGPIFLHWFGYLTFFGMVFLPRQRKFFQRIRQRDLISDLGGLDKCATKIRQSSSSKQTKTFPRFRKRRDLLNKPVDKGSTVVGCLTFGT